MWGVLLFIIFSLPADPVFIDGSQCHSLESPQDFKNLLHAQIENGRLRPI